jgi:hypothetical protein
MRVTRRTRPSRVGFGASIGRRRLLHASTSPEETVPEESGFPTLAVLIRFSPPETPPALGERFGRDHLDRHDAQTAVAVASSARGR